MTGPQNQVFQLINTNADYIEFVVSYVIRDCKWRVDGIGWIVKDNPTYYLRRLRLDGIPANPGGYARKALLAKRKMSYKFSNASLEELTLLNISRVFEAITNN